LGRQCSRRKRLTLPEPLPGPPQQREAQSIIRSIVVTGVVIIVDTDKASSIYAKDSPAIAAK
jgi:hypothetical protein